MHEAIGARNHRRPRLYGEEATPESWLTGGSSALRKLQEMEAARLAALAPPAQEEEEVEPASQIQVDESGHVSIITHLELPLLSHQAWDLLGDWDIEWARDTFDIRVDDSNRELTHKESGTVYAEREMERSERDCYYTYSRLANELYSAYVSKFSFRDQEKEDVCHQSITRVVFHFCLALKSDPAVCYVLVCAADGPRHVCLRVEHIHFFAA